MAAGGGVTALAARSRNPPASVRKSENGGWPSRPASSGSFITSSTSPKPADGQRILVRGRRVEIARGGYDVLLADREQHSHGKYGNHRRTLTASFSSRRSRGPARSSSPSPRDAAHRARDGGRRSRAAQSEPT